MFFVLDFSKANSTRLRCRPWVIERYSSCEKCQYATKQKKKTVLTKCDTAAKSSYSCSKFIHIRKGTLLFGQFMQQQQNVTFPPFILWASKWVRNMNGDEVRVHQLHTRFNFFFEVLTIPGLFATILTTAGLPKYDPVVIKLL